MSKKLAAKASLIQLPPAPPAAAPGTAVRSDAPDARAKTAPGSMAHFMASQSVAVKEADELRERLKSFEGARPVRPLDPRTVRPSRWANRHADSFADAAFAELKAEIASAGTNVQPISVRPVLNRSTPDSEAAYELVFGHRRHRACLELGLPVQAMVVDLDDQALFEAMDRENRSRKNLCAWEQGMTYRRALDEGLYPSQRRLAEALGVDIALVSKSLALARLPDAVVRAFPSPLDIQFRWAQPLSEALQKDPDGMLARAAAVRQSTRPMAAAQVLALLTGAASPAALNRSTPDTSRTIRGRAGRSATVSRDAQGRLTIRFEPGSLSPAAEAGVDAAVERLLAQD